MITVEKALKSSKTKNATETGASAKMSTKKKLLIGAGIIAAVWLGFKLFKGNRNNVTAKIHIPNQ
jgi:hypothetical protein